MRPGLIFSKLSPWFLLVAGLTLRAHADPPYLINAQQSGYQNEPRFIRDRFQYIDSLPFDGLTISTDTGRMLMNGSRRSYAQMSLDFGPLNHLVFQRLKHNFAVVNVNRPADFFDDWAVTIENFRLLARLLRHKEIEGIFFDNEEYDQGLFNYPKDCSYPSKSLPEYQDQARRRGREIMEAMVREYPTLVVIALHGPYSSFSGTPDEVRRGQTDWVSEELRGPFSVGLIEGLGEQATFVDGGEVYAYRTEDDFQRSYDYRKTTIASAAADCPFIPESLRGLWPQKVSIAFGVYNLPYGGAPMDSTILRPTLERAMKRADRYVWLYSEQLNWNAAGEAAPDWVDAVAGGRAAAGNPPATPAPCVAITSPGDRALLTSFEPITITANATSVDHTVTKVEFFDGVTKLGESSSAPFSYVWANPPAGTVRLSARATDDSIATTVSSPVTLTLKTRFAARINFQVAGVTPAVGYLVDAGETYGVRANGLTYGWNVSHVSNARHRRNSRIDLHLATLCQMQSGATWELAVPNGTYHVTVGVGDSDYPSTYTINVEGVKYWTAQPLKAGRFVRRTHTVRVADGKLTLDQGDGGFEETRINYITIQKR
ncbi:MAG: hypothetical protein QOE70_6692 [Chthoniobacter sp.]|jgi:hypothetical protein|nr:hypothetical protein [Chthoniobacter sp.]